MKFSGHETFQVREGWLHKGMKLVRHAPGLIADDHVSDHLGVGRNMAKSIRHWLIATQLCVPASSETTSKRSVLEMTEFGEIVWEHDPYFLDPATWWMLHVNLVNNPTEATSWTWFFNSFGHDRFDRSVCIESLRRHIELARKRLPSNSTLERDLGCLLISYARTIPAPYVDPEDGADCPFRELNLISHFKSSGYFQVNRLQKPIPLHVFGYSLAKSFDEATQNRKSVDVPIGEAARKPSGPGRVFCLTSESLFEVVSRIEGETESSIGISGLAGNRTIRIPCQTALDWAKQHYLNATEGSYVVS